MHIASSKCCKVTIQQHAAYTRRAIPKQHYAGYTEPNTFQVRRVPRRGLGLFLFELPEQIGKCREQYRIGHFVSTKCHIIRQFRG